MAKRLTLREFLDRAKQVHGDKYTYDNVNFNNTKGKVIITCPEHGDFPQPPNKHLKGQGCPKCKLPKGEQKIQKVLKALNVQFEQQHAFSDCRCVNPLPFDFLVKINETHFLIEFNGEQHYRPVKFGGLDDNTADDKFEEVKKRDEIKKDYAIKNGIPLLIIKYDETFRILEIIKEFLNIN